MHTAFSIYFNACLIISSRHTLKIRVKMRKRPYLTKEMCIRVVRAPARGELQENDRYRFWGRVNELGGRFLRVVTLSDRLTIHNAFLDRRFRL